VLEAVIFTRRPGGAVRQPHLAKANYRPSRRATSIAHASAALPIVSTELYKHEQIGKPLQMEAFAGGKTQLR